MEARSLGRTLFCMLCQEEMETEATVVPVPLGPLREMYCKEHNEKIYFFCKTDAELLCVLCRESPSHQAHTMGFLEEAMQPYRDYLQNQLEALRVERDRIEAIQSREDQKLHILLAHVENKKQKVENAFERLRQELGGQRHFLLARLREVEQQIWKERDEYLTNVSEELAQLGAQVEELEEKCQWPGSELLQEARLKHSRGEMKPFVNPEAISSDLANKIRELHRQILLLPEIMRTFSENLVHHLETDSEGETEAWEADLPLSTCTCSRSFLVGASPAAVPLSVLWGRPSGPSEEPVPVQGPGGGAGERARGPREARRRDRDPGRQRRHLGGDALVPAELGPRRPSSPFPLLPFLAV